MQPLKDYLNESPLSEGIFDRIKNNIKGNINQLSDNIKGNINRLPDSIIRKIIYKYCADRYTWRLVQPLLKITKVDKDEKGWYIDTETTIGAHALLRDTAKSFYDSYPFNGQKMDKQKGFLIKDTGVYFRWRKHKGTLIIKDCPNFESTEGLPEELDVLEIVGDFRNSKSLDIRNKIKVIELSIEGDIKILGKGCKNVIIDPEYSHINITAPSGVKIHRPKDSDEYISLLEKFTQL